MLLFCCFKMFLFFLHKNRPGVKGCCGSQRGRWPRSTRQVSGVIRALQAAPTAGNGARCPRCLPSSGQQHCPALCSMTVLKVVPVPGATGPLQEDPWFLGSLAGLVPLRPCRGGFPTGGLVKTFPAVVKICELALFPALTKIVYSRGRRRISPASLGLSGRTEDQI